MCFTGNTYGKELARQLRAGYRNNRMAVKESCKVCGKTFTAGNKNLVEKKIRQHEHAKHKKTEKVKGPKNRRCRGRKRTGRSRAARTGMNQGGGRASGRLPYDLIIGVPALGEHFDAPEGQQILMQPLNPHSRAVVGLNTTTPVTLTMNKWVRYRLKGISISLLPLHDATVSGFTTMLYYVPDPDQPLSEFSLTSMQLLQYKRLISSNRGTTLRIPASALKADTEGWKFTHPNARDPSFCQYGYWGVVIHGRPVSNLRPTQSVASELYRVRVTGFIEYKEYDPDPTTAFTSSERTDEKISVTTDESGSYLIMDKSTTNNALIKALASRHERRVKQHRNKNLIGTIEKPDSLGLEVMRISLRALDAVATVTPPPFSYLLQGAGFFARLLTPGLESPTGLHPEHEDVHILKMFRSQTEANLDKREEDADGFHLEIQNVNMDVQYVGGDKIEDPIILGHEKKVARVTMYQATSHSTGKIGPIAMTYSSNSHSSTTIYPDDPVPPWGGDVAIWSLPINSDDYRFEGQSIHVEVMYDDLTTERKKFFHADKLWALMCPTGWKPIGNRKGNKIRDSMTGVDWTSGFKCPTTVEAWRVGESGFQVITDADMLDDGVKNPGWCTTQCLGYQTVLIDPENVHGYIDAPAAGFVFTISDWNYQKFQEFIHPPSGEVGVQITFMPLGHGKEDNARITSSNRK